MKNTSISEHRHRISRWQSEGTPFAVSAALVALFLPLIKGGIQVPIALLVVTWLFTPKARLKEVWLPIFIFSSIYIFHLLGMLYTENVPRGMRDLEQKLALILMPIIFGTARPLKTHHLKWVLYAFCAGTLLEVLIAFGTSFQIYRHSQDVMSFYMSDFSPVHHPSYVAMYVTFTLAVLTMGILSGYFGRNKWRWFAWAVVLFLSLSLIFPASKMGFIVFGGFVIWVGVMAWQRRVFLTTDVAILFAVALLFGLFLIYDPVAQSRLAATVEVVKEPTANAEVGYMESNQARIIAWQIALEEIRQNPMGVGTGDINDVLVARYLEDGYTGLAEIELNPHNNFLQIGLAQGLPALLFFILALAWPIRRIWQEHNWLYAFLLLSVIVNMMVESMLEKQSGVLFFAFFNALLFFSHSFTKRSTCTP